MTTKQLINIKNDNIKIKYKKDIDENYPCIVDISNCSTINDMLSNIESFRKNNYYSDDILITTSFNTENVIQINNNGENEYIQGNFDFDKLNKKDIIFYHNLHIDNELIVSGNITAFADFNSVSDNNLKYNINKIENSLTKIEQLKPVSFNWKHNNESDIGFIANDIQPIFPNLVKNNNYKLLKENKLIPYLVNSIKILKNRIRDIKNGNY